MCTVFSFSHVQKKKNPFSGGGAAAGCLVGLELSPHFDMPQFSSSYADLWGRRWNLVAGHSLRFLVYDPLAERELVKKREKNNGGKTHSKRVGLGRRLMAMSASFVVSGIIHEGELKKTERERERVFFSSILTFFVQLALKKKIYFSFSLPTSLSSRAPLRVAWGLSVDGMVVPLLLRMGAGPRGREGRQDRSREGAAVVVVSSISPEEVPALPSAAPRHAPRRRLVDGLREAALLAPARGAGDRGEGDGVRGLGSQRDPPRRHLIFCFLLTFFLYFFYLLAHFPPFLSLCLSAHRTFSHSFSFKTLLNNQN